MPDKKEYLHKDISMIKFIVNNVLNLFAFHTYTDIKEFL